jgi:hypothetical protein
VSGPIDGDAARRAAETELRKAAYHRDDPGLISRLISRAVDWLARRLDFVFSGSAGGSATLLLLVLLGASIAFAVLKAARSRALTRADRDSADPLRPSASADHRRLAEQYAASGQWDLAQREWLRAAVQTVEQRGILTVRPGRTGQEFAREAGEQLPSGRDVLSAAVEAFDLVWFGGRTATASDVATARAADEAARTARVERLGTERTDRFAVPR